MWDIPRIIIRHYSYLKSSTQRSKVEQGDIKGTSGNPKGRKSYGFGASVVDHIYQREAETRTFPTSTIINPSGGDICRKLRKINIDIIVNYKVIHTMGDLNVLIFAYENIESSQGNLTPGSSTKTFNGVDLPYTERISKESRAGKYFFSPTIKRHNKTEKNKLKPLNNKEPLR